MTEIVSVDIGGTHARFAIAEVEGGRVVSLGEPVTLKTAEHGSLQLAWEAFGKQLGKPMPARRRHRGRFADLGRSASSSPTTPG